MRTAPLLLSLSILALCLAACGSLPQPFYGNPGNAGSLLAQPPPSRLAVPPPTESLLSDKAAAQWSQAVADALQEQEIPAAATAPRGRDWTVILSAEMQGGQVLPSYTVQNPAGESQGVSQGAPVPPGDWAAGSPAVLKAAAAQAAPGIASLLGRIEAARRQSDPKSLQNRPARVFLAAMTGAPGDGNRSLPLQMRIKLEANGIVVQDTPKDADFEVKGEIQTAAGVNSTTRIELQWVVSDAKSERGRVVQINEVPPRSINPYWGDVAVAVATEAAGGVRDVIVNAGGGRPAK